MANDIAPLGTTTPSAELVAGGLSNTALLIRKLGSTTPATHGGIPVGIYRSDLLPSAKTLEQLKTEKKEPDPNDLEAAYVELGFQEGFPTMPGGAPFWMKFDFEPSPAFNAFSLYLEQAETGPRSLHHVAQNPVLKMQFNGKTQELVNEWYTIYYWAQRAKAHDIYREAAYRHIRAKRALYTEDNHFSVAERLLKLATDYMSTPAFIEDMTPKTALEALKIAASLQRVSVGLPAGGPLSSKEEVAQTPGNWELVVRQVAQRNDAGTFDSSGNLIGDQSLNLNTFLDDPEHANIMQEVIIRMSAASKGRTVATPSRETPSDSAVQAKKDDIIDVEPLPPKQIEDGQ